MRARQGVHGEARYEELALEGIYEAIQNLFGRVPAIPEHGFLHHQVPASTGQNSVTSDDSESSATSDVVAEGSLPRYRRSIYNKEELFQWADDLHRVLEEFALLTCCIGPAVFTWVPSMTAVERENYDFLASEFLTSQGNMAAQIKPLLLNILTPTTSLVQDKVIQSVDEQGQSIHQTCYRTLVNDRAFVEFCYDLLGRNAIMVRQLLLANFDRILRAIRRYLDLHGDVRSSSHG